jgi:hypothetical protein
MSKAEMNHRTERMARLTTKMLEGYGVSTTAKRLTHEEQAEMNSKMYHGDVRRFNNAHNRAIGKYWFVPPTRKVSPSSREELIHRFYGSQKTRDEKLAILRRKHIHEPPGKAVTDEELAEIVARLAKGERGGG